MGNRSWSRWASLGALMATAVFGTGCVTNGRQVLLKEYGPSVPVANQGLNGTTICVGKFDCVTNLVIFDLKSKDEEPTGFKYADFTKEQDKAWDKEMKTLQKQVNKADWRPIGNMRNGFGMVMSHVYALNDPGEWLAESLKLDLAAQGAKVVDESQAASADASISGTVQMCRVDMFMTVGGELVVDIDVKGKNGATQHRQIHTHGATAAMLASEGEYFHALRDCRQKFSILATQELMKAVKQ